MVSNVEAVRRLSLILGMSRTEFRRQLKVEDINPLKRADEALSAFIFGENTPIRFLRDYSVQSLEAGTSRLLRAYDAYCYFVENNCSVLDQIQQLSAFTFENIYSKRDDYKKVVKSWMKEDLPFLEQFEKSFLLSLYVCVNETISNQAIADYLGEFNRDEPNLDKPYFRAYDDKAILGLAQYIEATAQVDPNKILAMPAPAVSRSSTGRKKKYDGEAFATLMDGVEINSFAAEHLEKCLKAISVVYRVDCSGSIEPLMKLRRYDDSLEGLEFLPRLVMIPQSRGKVVRPVYPSTDYSDMALTPFMRLLKTLMQPLPCNLSSAGRSKSMYSRVAEKSSAMLAGITFSTATGETMTFSDGMEDLDSSNATERESGLYQWQIFEKLWNSFSEEFRQSTGITDEYLLYVKEILLWTPYVALYDGRVNLSYPYGTSQGLRGSWDLLNLCTCVTILLGYTDLMCKTYVEDTAIAFARGLLFRSGHNGDDGLYAVTAGPYVKRRLQLNSLPGVISQEKSASESELGYLCFSSAYVRTNKAPKLSNMRILSLISAQSDPESYAVYTADRYMNMQLMQVKGILEQFKTRFNIGDQPIYTEPEFVARSKRYTLAMDALRFSVYQGRNMLVPLTLVAGTNVNLTKELTASIRCRAVMVENSSISMERYELLMLGKQLEQCFYLGKTVVGDLFERLEEARRDYILRKEIPVIPDSYYQDLFNTYLLGAEWQSQVLLPKRYQVSYRDLSSYIVSNHGYDDQVLSVKMRIEVK